MSKTPKLTPEEQAEAAILHERLSEDGDELERFIYSAVFIRARLERELAAERERADRLIAFLADDALAMTYQSLAQYRQAAIDAARRK